MPSTNNAFGMKPIHHPDAQAHVVALLDGVASGFNTDIYFGQPVKLLTNGTLSPVTATTDDFVGVFQGVTYIPPGGLRPVQTNWWPANATYLPKSCTVWFTRSPDLVYEVQADGALTQAAIGDECNFTNLTGNTGITGNSTATISATPAGAGNQGQVRIIDKSLRTDNDWGDAYTIVQVMVARHQFVANKTAF